MAPIRDGICEGVGTTSGVVRLVVLTVVLMNTSTLSRTSLLARASFYKIIFHPGFLGMSEKKTCIV